MFSRRWAPVRRSGSGHVGGGPILTRPAGQSRRGDRGPGRHPWSLEAVRRRHRGRRPHARGGRRGVPRAARAVRLRQVDRAAHDRRARGADRRHHRDRRPRGQRRRGEGPRRRHGVPELRALPAHDGAEERRVPAEDAQGRGGRAETPRAGGGGHPRPRGPARPQAGAALGRSAPAGGARPGDRAPAAGVPHGRAALEPRRQAARADARRARRAAPPAAGDDRLRHARPGRGDDDGRPHRHPRPGRAPAGRPAPGRVRAPGEPLRRPLHRQPADEHGHGRRDARRRERRRARSPAASSRFRARSALPSRAGLGTRRARRATRGPDPDRGRADQGDRLRDRVARPRATRGLPARGRAAHHRAAGRERLSAGRGERGRPRRATRRASTSSTPSQRNAWTHEHAGRRGGGPSPRRGARRRPGAAEAPLQPGGARSRARLPAAAPRVRDLQRLHLLSVPAQLLSGLLLARRRSRGSRRVTSASTSTRTCCRRRSSSTASRSR